MENQREEFSFFVVCPFFAAKMVLFKEEHDQPKLHDEGKWTGLQIWLIMDHSRYHGQSMVSSVSVIFYYFFLPWAWWQWGSVGVKLYSIMENFGVK